MLFEKEKVELRRRELHEDGIVVGSIMQTCRQ